jgi:hypothetical protein
LNVDGSAGLLVWKNESRTNAQIVVLNANGSIQFQADCGRDVWSPIVAPDGAGVLLRPNTGGTNQNTFIWFTKQGKLRSIDINPNPWCVGWISGSQKSLFWTSLGTETNRYQLIDWDIGKRLWDIPRPGDGQLLAIGLTPNFIIFAVAQRYLPAPWHDAARTGTDSGKEWLRTFYAVKVQDGSLTAQWQALFPRRSLDAGRDHFLWLGDKFFYVTPEEFTELNLEDIGLKEHGWR